MEYPGYLSGSDVFDWYFKSPDGETFDDACRRVKVWLAEVTSPTIAVSHGLTGRLLRGAYLGLSRHDCLQLPVPQDGFFRLKDGQVDLIT
jgi:probable phosphoglycerate mutase